MKSKAVAEDDDEPPPIPPRRRRAGVGATAATAATEEEPPPIPPRRRGATKDGQKGGVEADYSYGLDDDLSMPEALAAYRAALKR